MPARFSDHLREMADPIWQAQHAHPFVRGIGDGTLDLERFQHWVRQDYLFLIDYARFLSLAAARAPDLETMTRFVTLAQETLSTEMSLHCSYAQEFGISDQELEREPKAPATQGYTDFLLRTASHGSYPELIAALLPCMWGFCEVGLRLNEGPLPQDSRYRRWIEMYASPEFQELAEWCRKVVDRVAEGLSPEVLGGMERAFVTSSRYEYLFWEMAFKLEQWPV